MSEPANVSAVSWESREVLVSELVRDAALQCRAEGVIEEVVANYAQAMKDGDVFPAAKVVDVDGKLLLVDGWHREAAHRHAFADLKPFAILVRKGTRRDALLEAIGANGKHGQPRSNADKRRAVKLLLMDAEWCQLSTRQLGAIADVSGVYVTKLRKHYGVAAGELLSAERAEQVDGEPSPTWKAILAEGRWVADDINQVRVAKDLDALIEAWRKHRHSPSVQKAVVLRLAELQTDGWPLAGEGTGTYADRLEHTRILAMPDTEIKPALQSKDCPSEAVAELLDVLANLADLPKMTSTWQLENLEKLWKDRHPLLPAVRERLKAVKAEEKRRQANDPWQLARLVHEEADAPSQASRLRNLPKSVVLENIHAEKLFPEVRDGAYREIVVPQGAPECPDPSCGGWVKPKHGYHSERCVRCGSVPSQVRRDVVDAMRRASRMLATPGLGVRVGEAVVDAPSIALLDSLQKQLDDARVAAWIDRAPASVKETLRAWQQRPTPRVLEDEEEASEDEDLDDEEDELDEDGDDLEDDDEEAGGAEDLDADAAK